MTVWSEAIEIVHQHALVQCNFVIRLFLNFKANYHKTSVFATKWPYNYQLQRVEALFSPST